MLIEIKHRHTQAVLFTHDAEAITLALAVKSEANLTEANLTGADLTGARILCTGDMKFIHSMQLDTWSIAFTKDMLEIGCQRHSIEAWRNFDDSEVNDMHPQALVWWHKWKDHILKTIELCAEGSNNE
jgi:hypothetical protein